MRHLRPGALAPQESLHSGGNVTAVNLIGGNISGNTGIHADTSGTSATIGIRQDAGAIVTGLSGNGIEAFSVNGNITFTGAGFDTVDVAACSAAGVLVLNQTGANAQSVAEHAMYLMLAASRLGAPAILRATSTDVARSGNNRSLELIWSSWPSPGV